MQENTVFSTLSAINCNEHTERKGNLTYLSWAWAWQMVKTHFPEATYTVYENPAIVVSRPLGRLFRPTQGFLK